ncbi:heptaprenyl diphosphate synthase component II [Evansella cellulosilytica]|uniref:Heptaprenyl diphosphate synthase component 2 n=1 Tax=Evansella cellulosilytica (strain ATCC 21833 / DSM 2522 / FERM P-1141 / JCM 9156 / N-4) TaxID=649639 RepID=E6TZF8_EVAC2|nr:heptaprenyl diphosphate synthase component II [Evansella cellulosilytica]ADU30132.1 heptaprenyl diphosphate synthase component II [Evansella cellulosilytica DSM 2522]
MKLTDIYWDYKPDINKIEKEIELNIDANHPILQEASSHLLKAGGKRIRPVFVLLSAQFGEYNIEEIKNIGVALEMIHMASLVHDDVVDDADLRRGKKTIKSKWDNRVAMYTGDYIFAKAVEIATYYDTPDIHKILSHALVEMCIGEVEQIRDQYDWNQNLRMYFRRIKRKTALLIAISCQLGAIASGAPEAHVRALSRFGYNVGMAFQITDDILDFVGTEKELGKPAGSDLLQGNITLPALYAMCRCDDVKGRIIHHLDENVMDKKEMGETISLIKDTGAIDFSKNIADRYLMKSIEALNQLPDSKAKTALQKIANYIGDRKF